MGNSFHYIIFPVLPNFNLPASPKANFHPLHTVALLEQFLLKVRAYNDIWSRVLQS